VLFTERNGQILVRLDVVGFELQGESILCNCPIQILLVMKNIAQIIVCFYEVWL